MSLADLDRRHLLGLGLAALLGACASKRAAPDLVAALAPTGRLRACINLGNPILAQRAAADAPVVGVSVDLARALAERLGLEADLRVVDAAAKSVALVKSGEADVGFFAVDPLRGEGIRFTAPYVQIEGAYLVRQASPFTDNAQVDSAGTRIMVGRGSAYDLHLARTLRQARLMHAPTSPTVVERFLAEGADVAAGVKQQLQADAARLPDLRLLPGRFMLIEQAMGLPLTRSAAAAQLLRDFVEQAKASGFVAAALARHGIQGAVVAPPA
ncbi:ABC transporter substrate-binding protein [Rubrivivax sp. A210]|uniref:transporter substrate-binding domain-containing protein n=1 Tax=Rubrivivax sp. A210 TaxID=2772301 RepID=UPI001917FC49|nr:transporter substrate-binding domain-containing protein [Rubrivivax sp. A210]CAD5371872.1 ABC transporter substrate-binding protein [Rubrivivax sp. A210]